MRNVYRDMPITQLLDLIDTLEDRIASMAKTIESMHSKDFDKSGDLLELEEEVSELAHDVRMRDEIIFCYAKGTIFTDIDFHWVGKAESLKKLICN